MLLAAYRYGGYGFYFDPTYFLVVIGLLLSLWASSVVNSTFKKIQKCAACPIFPGLRPREKCWTAAAFIMCPSSTFPEN